MSKKSSVLRTPPSTPKPSGQLRSFSTPFSSDSPPLTPFTLKTPIKFLSDQTLKWDVTPDVRKSLQRAARIFRESPKKKRQQTLKKLAAPSENNLLTGLLSTMLTTDEEEGEREKLANLLGMESSVLQATPIGQLRFMRAVMLATPNPNFKAKEMLEERSWWQRHKRKVTISLVVGGIIGAGLLTAGFGVLLIPAILLKTSGSDKNCINTDNYGSQWIIFNTICSRDS